MLFAMKQTFTLSENLVNDVDKLRRDLGFADAEATIQYLLQNAIDREKKQIVVRYYKNEEKRCGNAPSSSASIWKR
jgi:hypothetical protein